MKILIIQTAFLGDTILSSAVIPEINKFNNKVQIDILLRPPNQEVFKHNPYISNIHVFDKNNKTLLESIIWAKKILKPQQYNICFLFQKHLRSAFMAKAADIRHKIGFNKFFLPSLFYTHKFPYEGDHEVSRITNLIRKYFNKTFSSLPKPKIYLSSEEIQQFNNKFPYIKNSKYILLAPDSEWPTKQWPPNYYSQLAENINSQLSLPTILVGTNNKLKEFMNSFSLPNTYNLIGETNLRELFFLVKNASLVVSNDSACIHIASSFNIPTIQIYGSTSSKFGYYTLSETKKILEKNELSCHPCSDHGLNKCPENHFKCMREQKPEYVFQKVKQIHEGTS